MIRKKILKLISVVMSVSFLWQDVMWAVPSHLPPVICKLSSDIYIPEQYGSIEKPHDLSSPESQVVLIKDAHCNYEAQKNIAKILDILIKDYKIDLVCVEGASNKVDPSIIASSPDDKRRKEVADEYLKKGYLTSVEVLAMERGKDYGFSIWGVEDLKLYLEDLKAFREVYSGDTSAGRFIELSKNLISNLKNRLYPEDVLAFDKKIQTYKDNKLSLTGLIGYLYVIDKGRFIKYSNLRLVLKALILEKATNFNKVENERALIIKNIESRYPKEDIQGLVKNSLLYKLGKVSSLDYYSYLKRFILPSEYRNYPNLHRYIQIIKIHSKIEEDDLFKELDALIESIYKIYIKDEISVKLHIIDGYINLLDKLLRLEITRDELERYRKSDITLSDAVNFIKIQTGADIDIPDELTKQPEEFYRYALERDNALINNLVKRMEEAGKDKAIIIIGGFHAEGVEKLLKEKNVQVITITPSITKEDIEAKKIYLSRMMDKRIQPDEMIRQLGLNNLGTQIMTGIEWQDKFSRELDAIKNAAIGARLRGVMKEKENLVPEDLKAALRAELQAIETEGRIEEADRVKIGILKQILGEEVPPTSLERQVTSSTGETTAKTGAGPSRRNITVGVDKTKKRSGIVDRELTEKEIDELLIKVRSLLAYILSTQPAVVEQWFKDLDIDLPFGDVSEVNISYYASGHKKDVFRIEVKSRSGSRTFKLALKSDIRREEGLFEKGELEGLRELQGTGLVPKLGGLIYVEKTESGYGEITSSPLGNKCVTIEAEEFIEGPTVAQCLDRNNHLDPDIAGRCLLTLMRIFFTLNSGGVENFRGPSDFHLNNIVVEENTGRAVLVDFGEQVSYHNLEEFLMVILFYYAGRRGEMLQGLYKEWPEIDWDSILNTIRGYLIRMRKIFQVSMGETVFSIGELPFKRNDCNRIAKAITTFLENKKKGKTTIPSYPGLGDNSLRSIIPIIGTGIVGFFAASLSPSSGWALVKGAVSEAPSFIDNLGSFLSSPGFWLLVVLGIILVMVLRFSHREEDVQLSRFMERDTDAFGQSLENSAEGVFDKYRMEIVQEYAPTGTIAKVAEVLKLRRKAKRQRESEIEDVRNKVERAKTMLRESEQYKIFLQEQKELADVLIPKLIEYFYKFPDERMDDKEAVDKLRFLLKAYGEDHLRTILEGFDIHPVLQSYDIRIVRRVRDSHGNKFHVPLSVSIQELEGKGIENFGTDYIITFSERKKGVSISHETIDKAKRFLEFNDLNYKALELLSKCDKTEKQFIDMLNAIEKFVERYLELFEGLGFGDLDELRGRDREIAELIGAFLSLKGKLISRIHEGKSAAFILGLKAIGFMNMDNLAILDKHPVIRDNPEYKKRVLSTSEFCNILINIFHQKGLEKKNKVLVGAGTTDIVSCCTLNTIEKEAKTFEGVIEFIDLREGGQRKAPPLPIRLLTEGFTRNLGVNPTPSLGLSIMKVFADERDAQIFFQIGIHGARIQFHAAPPEKGGRIAIEYTEFENRDLDRASDRAKTIRARFLRDVFKQIGFEAEYSGRRFDAKYDKDCGGADSLESLIDMVVLSLEILDNTAGIDTLPPMRTDNHDVLSLWSQYYRENGFLPFNIWTDEKRWRNNEYDQTAGRLSDIITQDELMPDGQEAKGQIFLNRMIDQEERGVLAGRKRYDGNGCVDEDEYKDKARDPVEYLLEIMEDDENLDNLRENALIAEQIIDLGRREEIGRVGGYVVERLIIPIPKNEISLFLLKEADSGKIHLAYAVFGTQPVENIRYIDSFTERIFENNIIISSDQLKEILNYYNYHFSVEGEPIEIKEIDRVLSGQTHSIDSEVSPVKIGGVVVNRGISFGRLVFNSDSRQEADFKGGVLISRMTNPGDDPKIRMSRGIITTSGGALSHAAIRAREFKKPGLILRGAEIHGDKLIFETYGREGAVTGQRVIRGRNVVYHSFTGEKKKVAVKEGDIVVVDGERGCIYIIGDSEDVKNAYEYLLERKIDKIIEILKTSNDITLARFIIQGIINDPGIDINDLINVISAIRENEAIRERVQVSMKGLVQDSYEDARKTIEEMGLRAKDSNNIQELFYMSQMAKDRCEGYKYLQSAIQFAEMDKTDELQGRLNELISVIRSRVDAIRSDLIIRLEKMQQRLEQGEKVSYIELERMQEEADYLDINLASEYEKLNREIQTRKKQIEEEVSLLTSGESKCYVVWKGDVSRPYRPSVGGKAENSGEIVKVVGDLGDEKIKTPQGFVVTTRSYSMYRENNLEMADEVRNAIRNAYWKIICVQYRNLVNLAKAIEGEGMAKLLQEMEENGAVFNEEVEKTDADIYNAIIKIRKILEPYYKKFPVLRSAAMCFGSVAARSSGVREDRKTESFAGQKLTKLNVVGVDNLISSIKSVWESGAEGVLVEEMVDSYVSGVSFSVNTSTGNFNQVLVDSVYGLGEGYVSGKVDPDRFIVSKEGDIEEEKPILGKKKTKFVFSDESLSPSEKAEDFTTEVPVSDNERRRLSLGSEELMKIVNTVKALEKHFGMPIDVEWAFDSQGNLFILQVRPVTTLWDDINKGKGIVMGKDFAPQHYQPNAPANGIDGSPSSDNIGKGVEFRKSGDKLIIRLPNGNEVEVEISGLIPDINSLKEKVRQLNASELGEDFIKMFDNLQVMVFTGTPETQAAGAFAHVDENGVVSLDEVLLETSAGDIRERVKQIAALGGNVIERFRLLLEAIKMVNEDLQRKTESEQIVTACDIVLGSEEWVKSPIWYDLHALFIGVGTPEETKKRISYIINRLSPPVPRKEKPKRDLVTLEDWRKGKRLKDILDVLEGKGFFKSDSENIEYTRNKLEEVAEKLELQPGQRYLHVGASYSRVVILLTLLGVECTYLDMLPVTLIPLREKLKDVFDRLEIVYDSENPPVKFVRCNIDSADSEMAGLAGSFDVITMFHVFFQFRGNLELGIKNLLTLVKSGGTIWFTPKTDLTRFELIPQGTSYEISDLVEIFREIGRSPSYFGTEIIDLDGPTGEGIKGSYPEPDNKEVNPFEGYNFGYRITKRMAVVEELAGLLGLEGEEDRRNLEAILQGETPPELLNTLRELLTKDIKDEDELRARLQIIFESAEKVVRILNMVMVKDGLPEDIRANLSKIQEALTIYLAVNEMRRRKEDQKMPKFLKELSSQLKALASDKGFDPDMIDNLMEEIRKADGYYAEIGPDGEIKIIPSPYFLQMLDWIMAVFGEKPELKYLLEKLNRYKCAEAVAKSKFKITTDGVVTSPEQIQRIVMDYLGRRPSLDLSILVEIIARYVTSEEEILDWFSGDELKVVRNGLETLKRRDRLYSEVPALVLSDLGDIDLSIFMEKLKSDYVLLSKKPRCFIYALYGIKQAEVVLDSRLGDKPKWQDDIPLIVEAKTLQPNGEGAVWLIKERAESRVVKILYDGTEEREATRLWLLEHGVKVENIMFITATEYPTEGKAVCLLSEDTATVLEIPGTHRVIKCKVDSSSDNRVDSNITDMALASRAAAILGSYEKLDGIDIKEKFGRLYRAYGLTKEEIEKYVAQINIKEGVALMIGLPPITPFVKVYYDMLKSTKEIVASAA